MKSIKLPATVLMLLSVLCSPWSQAQDEPRISELTNIDRQYMADQRRLIDDLARSQVGRQFSGNIENDLALLQLLLDRRLVRPEQKQELQAMGVIMGDLLAEDLDLNWVLYEDQQGRSRALRYRNGTDVLFPITMISRRREADNRTPVADIYAKARDRGMAIRPPLPFQ